MVPLSGMSHGSVFERGLLLLAVAYVALVSLPAPWVPYGTGLDASWLLGLNLARHQGLVAGRDIVFTYGPLGYLTYPDPVSGTPIAALLQRVGLYLIAMAALIRLVLVHESKVTVFWVTALLGVAFALTLSPAQSQDVMTATVVAILALADRSKWRWLELAVLAILAAFESLVKLNQGAEWIAVFLAVMAAAYPLRDLRARRLWFAVLACLPLSGGLLYWLSTGSLAGLAGYIRLAWEIGSGHSEAMGLTGPLWPVALAAATIALSFSAVLLTAVDFRALLPGLAPALIVAFFSFKQSMVRQDPHAVYFHLRFACGLLLVLVCARLARDRRLILVLASFSIAMGYAISEAEFPTYASDCRDRAELKMTGQTLAAFWNWRTTWANVGAVEHVLRGALRLPARYRQIVGNGTVDAEPWDVDVVEANGWRWRPRPAFQSYLAYTPMLDGLNAGHLEGGHTADFVLLKFSAIDGRHPFLETPHSWHALLDRYDLVLATESGFLLQHRYRSRYEPILRVGESMAHWDETVRVPRSTGILMMGPQMRPSLGGKIESMLFRSAAVYMDAFFSSGRTRRWRCIPRNLAAGFLIRPFPQELRELEPLFRPDLFPDSSDRIVSVRFHADKPQEYRPEIPIVWSSLRVAESGKEPAASHPDYPFPKGSLTRLWLPGDRPPQATNALIAAHPHWIEVTPTTDDPQLLFDIGPGLGRFSTLIVRVRFEKADRIDAFFGKQVEGRGVSGVVPMAARWLDVYLNVSQNPYWEEEHGTMLRFDPVSSVGPATKAYIAGVWGSTQAAPAVWPEVGFYAVPGAVAETGQVRSGAMEAPLRATCLTYKFQRTASGRFAGATLWLRPLTSDAPASF